MLFKKVMLASFVIFAFFALSGVSLAAVKTLPPSNLGIIGYWSFDEGSGSKTGDFSGKRNNGTISGATWADGTRSKALYFNGTDTNVGVTGSNSLKPTGSITISAFIKIPSSANNKTITIRGNTYNVVPWAWFSYLGGSNKLGLWNYNGNSWASSTAISVEDNKWHHVTVSATTGSAPNFYLDGVNINAIGENTYSETVYNINSFPFEIGSRTHTTGIIEELTGSIDEVRIYNRALSAAEVKSLYNSGATKFNAPQTSRLTDGLAGYWSFNGPDVTDKVYDRSGNSNNGYLYNVATSSAKTIGKIGQALSFDGVNDYVNLGVSPTLTPSDITLSAWVRANALSSWNGIISNMTSWGTGFSLQIGTVQKIAAMISGTYLTTSWAPSAGVWYHITATHNNSTNENILYVNGVRENSVIKTVSYEENAKTYIGVFYTSPSLFFNGIIDEVRIYNRALSAAEVKSLYNSGATKFNTPQTSRLANGLVGYWSFNGPDVTDKVYDRSGNSNNGYFYGGATSSAKTIGKVGQGLKFDGVNDCVVASSMTNTSKAEETISMWVKPSSVTGTRYFTSQGSGSGGLGNYLIIIQSGANVLARVWNNGVYNDTTASSVLTAGKWTHISFVHSVAGSINKLYIDGVEAANGSMYQDNSSNHSYIAISGNSCNGNFSYGSIDEVRLYNRALSATEIKQLYLMGK